MANEVAAHKIPTSNPSRTVAKGRRKVDQRQAVVEAANTTGISDSNNSRQLSLIPDSAIAAAKTTAQFAMPNRIARRIAMIVLRDCHERGHFRLACGPCVTLARNAANASFRVVLGPRARA